MPSREGAGLDKAHTATVTYRTDEGRKRDFTAVPTGEYQSDPPSLPRAIRCSSARASPSTPAAPL